MCIKAVIFDLDGTLFNSIEDIADANNAMLESFGFKTHALDKYVSWIGNGALRLVRLSLPENERDNELKLQTYLKEYERLYKKNISVKSKLYNGVELLLNNLSVKNIPMAIHTNKPQQLTDIVVQKYLSIWNFECIIGQSNNYPKKPDPAGALQISKSMRIAPEHILFVGDSLIDINTAKNAGMLPLGVSWGYGDVSDELCAEGIAVVDSVQQMINFINSKVE